MEDKEWVQRQALNAMMLAAVKFGVDCGAGAAIVVLPDEPGHSVIWTPSARALGTYISRGRSHSNNHLALALSRLAAMLNPQRADGELSYHYGGVRRQEEHGILLITTFSGGLGHEQNEEIAKEGMREMKTALACKLAVFSLTR